MNSQQKECIEQCIDMDQEHIFCMVGGMEYFPEVLGTHLAVDVLHNKKSVFLLTNDIDTYQHIFHTISTYLPISFQVRRESSCYISPERYFSYIFSQENISFSQLIFFAKIALWLCKTKTGNLDELSWYPNEHQYRIFLSGFPGEKNPYFTQEETDIFLVTPMYFIKEYSGQYRHVYISSTHLLEEQLYKVYQKDLYIDAMEQIAIQLKESGQYAHIGDNLLKKNTQLRPLLTEYIITTQDNTSSVNIRISNLWSHISTYCFDCRQELYMVDI